MISETEIQVPRSRRLKWTKSSSSQNWLSFLCNILFYKIYFCIHIFCNIIRNIPLWYLNSASCTEMRSVFRQFQENYNNNLCLVKFGRVLRAVGRSWLSILEQLMDPDIEEWKRWILGDSCCSNSNWKKKKKLLPGVYNSFNHDCWNLEATMMPSIIIINNNNICARFMHKYNFVSPIIFYYVTYSF